MRQRTNRALNQLHLGLERAPCHPPPQEVVDEVIQVLAILLLEAYEGIASDRQSAQGDRDELEDHC